MPDDPRLHWLELRIAGHLERVSAHLKRVSAGTDLTVEMVRRSREQYAKSLDLLQSSEVPKVWHPDPESEQNRTAIERRKAQAAAITGP